MLLSSKQERKNGVNFLALPASSVEILESAFKPHMPRSWHLKNIQITLNRKTQGIWVGILTLFATVYDLHV